MTCRCWKFHLLLVHAIYFTSKRCCSIFQKIKWHLDLVIIIINRGVVTLRPESYQFGTSIYDAKLPYVLPYVNPFFLLSPFRTNQSPSGVRRPISQAKLLLSEEKASVRVRLAGSG